MKLHGLGDKYMHFVGHFHNKSILPVSPAMADANARFTSKVISVTNKIRLMCANRNTGMKLNSKPQRFR